MKNFINILCRSIILLYVAILMLAMIGCDSELPNESDTTQTEESITTENTEDTISSEDESISIYNDPNWASDNWIIDIDPDWPDLYCDPTSTETAEATMDDYFSYIFNTGVTDIILCPYEQSSLVPTESDAITWRYEKVNWTDEGGHPVSYDQFDLFGNGYTFNKYYDLFTKENTDIYEMAFEKIREAGIRPWLSFRMNDRHYTGDEGGDTSYIRSEFYYEALENGYMIGSDYGDFHAYCLDYSEERVRQVMYDYLREMILRYDVFGVQLDFIRCLPCFKYLDDTDYAQYMTQFIRDIADVVKEAEAKFGHDIKLMLRLGRSIEHNLVYGFDVETIANENLVDAFVPSPRWDSVDSAIPVDEWKEVSGENIAVFIGMEERMDVKKDKSKIQQNTAEYVKGFSAGYLAQGADGIYFNNYYQIGSIGPAIWSLTPETLVQGNRRFKVTYQDLVPIGYEGYEPLPMPLTTDETSITVNLGQIRPTETLSVLVAYKIDQIKKNDPIDIQLMPNVIVNGKTASSLRIADESDSFYDGVPSTRVVSSYAYQTIVYTFEGIETVGELVVDFDVDQGCSGTVDHIELLVQ